MPGPAGDQDLEDAKLCTNSVEVGGKCFLAGTVNYALFGQMSLLCHDAGQPLDLMHFPPTEATMLRAIQMWKVGGLVDDDGPPSAWAIAGFRGYPGNVPDN